MVRMLQHQMASTGFNPFIHNDVETVKKVLRLKHTLLQCLSGSFLAPFPGSLSVCLVSMTRTVLSFVTPSPVFCQFISFV